MKLINKLLLGLCTGLPVLATGCSDDLLLTPTSQEGGTIRLTGKIEQEYQTRATDDGFAEGDAMGVFIVDYENGSPGILTIDNNRANNAKFELQGLDWNCSDTFYWKDSSTPIDVYGYYPFNHALTDVSAQPFEVEWDQTSAGTLGNPGSYEASDFLWAKAGGITPTSDRIQLQYTHRMAGMMVTLVKGDDINDIEWEKISKSVAVENLTRHSTIDLNTGIVTAEGDFDRQILMADQQDGTWRAVVVPQHVNSGTKLLSITIEDVAYAYTRTEALDLQQGKLHRFTLRIDKKADGGYALKLTGIEITPWENDRLTHNFIEYEYLVVKVDAEGMLKSAITAMGKDYATVKNLKIIGPIGQQDFDFMKSEMAELAMLNMKEAACTSIPEDALHDKTSIRRLILPDVVESVGREAFSHLGLDPNSTLILPASLKQVGKMAFAYMSNCGELVMNENLEIISEMAFASDFSVCHYRVTDALKRLEKGAFMGVKKFDGNFYIPQSIEFLEGKRYDGYYGAFSGAPSFEGVGEIIVPRSITTILPYMFPTFTRGCHLTLHDGITYIGAIPQTNSWGGLNDRYVNHVTIPSSVETLGYGAFEDAVFNGGLTLSPNLKSIEHRAFLRARGIKELELPEGLERIGGGAFADSDLEKVTIPSTVTQIEEDAFSCNLKQITIGKNCSYIGKNGLLASSALERVVCLNPTPPVLDKIETEGPPCCDFEHVVLEVPEKSIDLYRNASGWKQFRFITAYKELAVGVPEIKCLDKGTDYNTLVRAEGGWEVSECPSWVTVTPSSSDHKRTEIIIKVSPTSVGSEREGRVVFRLKDGDHTTVTKVSQLAYERTEDSIITMHSATKGEGIPVLFVGDGFDASSVANGDYMEVMNEACEHFFALEPYATYKEYFNASAAIAVSPDSGIESLGDGKGGTRLKTRINSGGLAPDYQSIRRYAATLDARFNSEKALIVMVPNFEAFMGMADHSETNATVAVCALCRDQYPYDFRGLVQHYAGGIGFGKLAPEYISHYEFIKGCKCGGCNGLQELVSGQAKGWYKNVSLSGAINAVPWSHLIFDNRYSDIVDVYEGAYRHLRGVWKSEAQSCMSTYVPYYNTYSRELIVRRIMALGGQSFNFEDFVSKDSRRGKP